MHGHEINVPWWGVLPFAMLLACIATFPLMRQTRRLWHKVWFQLAVALSFGVPMAIFMWSLGGHGAVVHALVEYSQFIILLLSLFVISGGIFVAGDIEATPRTNTIFLAIGAVLASFVGTTGAAMALIRPILNVNRQRTQKVHTVVFAIFIVANCGGLLTPLGDPPLFLGMLRGVPFLWTFKLFPAWLFVNGLLLFSYYHLDRRLHDVEPPLSLTRDASEIEPIRVRGRLHLLWLLGVVGAVALVPSVDLHAIATGHAAVVDYVPFRELAMLGLAGLSLATGDRQVRFVNNEFTWTPILEVAALFIGIFLAMTPALGYLGQVAPTLPLDEYTFFLFTGGLSSVLDNAPTYATFFEMARSIGGEPAVAGVREVYLESISLGAVFCGAITYIGNGPNFMVKSIADAAGVGMPSFGGYVVWALRHLVPILGLMVLTIIAPPLSLKVLGLVLTVAWIGFVLLRPRLAALVTRP
ncbi:MAG: sodium:proton antiporter [Polyangiaceae bacterium]|nr:sodium:proton antiporter [Polyangiaceae bacterium]